MKVPIVLTYQKKKVYFIWPNLTKVINLSSAQDSGQQANSKSPKVESKWISIHYFNGTDSNTGSVVHQGSIAIAAVNGVEH